MDIELARNISEWFNSGGGDIKIFSDYEGTTTTTQIENVLNIFKKDNEKCIYLGDIFDNANFKDTKIGEGTSPCIKNDNYCSLKMLKLFVDNPDKCRYVIGNRDINKIKLYPLLQFADGTKWWKKRSDGTLYETYSEIIENLLNQFKNNSQTLFLINSMEYYVPFWKGDLSKNCGKTNWTQPEQLAIGDLFDRYNKIFGQDCSDGTMSADYTIRGLPNELFGTTILSSMIGNLEKKEKVFNDEKEIRAAIVFTVFMRMLDQELWDEKKRTSNKEEIKSHITRELIDNKNNIALTLNKEKELEELGALDGYLYRYLNTAYPSLYAIKNNNLYIFAHGGITGGIPNTDASAEKQTELGNLFLNKRQNAFQLLNEVNWASVLNTDKTKLNNLMHETQIDYYEYNETTTKNCITRLDDFNNMYLLFIMNLFDFFETYNDPVPAIKKHTSKVLLTLLSLSAPAEENETIKSTGYTSDLSPIQARLPIESQIKNEIYGTNTYTKVYNFCGHASSGVGGYGFRNLADGTVCINTDYSTTLFKKDLPCDDTYDDNYLMMTLHHDGKFSISGKISIPTATIINYEIINNVIDVKSRPIYTTINYITDILDIDTIKIPSDFTDKKNTYKTELTMFNGIGTINNNSEKLYKIYSNFNNKTKTNFLYVEEIKKNTMQLIGDPSKFTNQIFGGGSKKNKKHSCKNKSCKKRNCKTHNNKKNNRNTKKYKNRNTKKN